MKLVYYGCAAYGNKVAVFPVYREYIHPNRTHYVNGNPVALFKTTKQAMEETGRRNLILQLRKNRKMAP